MVRLLLKNSVYKSLKNDVPNLVTKEYKKRVDLEYRRIIERTEGIGGVKNNSLEIILIFLAFAIAAYKAADGKVSEEAFFNAVDAISYSKKMKISGKLSNALSKKSIARHRNLSKKSEEKKYKNDWLSTFEHEDGSEEFFLTYTECGVCKVAKNEGVSHLVKYMCKMDYPSFESQGLVLDRTKTLASGDECCNFHVMSRKKADDIGFVKSKNAK